MSEAANGRARAVARWALAAFFLVAGGAHFARPDIYRAVMPPGWPAPDALVVISGIAEMLGGVGVLWPPVRRAAGWGLIVLLIVIFPANIHMAVAGVSPPGMDVSRLVLWLRLPVQGVFIAWVWWVALARSGGTAGKKKV